MATKTKVGIIGAGNIFDQYIKGCRAFEILDVTTVADLDLDRAKSRGQQYDLNATSVEELLADPEIQIVVNLTIPAAHAEVTLKALEAGKNVHQEKPFALTREDGQNMLDKAEEKGLLLGCAPDTFMGAGGQTARKIIDDGWIGRPVAATAFMLSHGPESWHPNPDFFYQFGGGPMFDMGPYYLTALVNLLGPVRRVTGSAQKAFEQRTATSEALFGHVIDVEVATHIASVLDFESGAVGTLITSFDVWSHNLPRIEIYGTEGSMSVPDPNHFRGPVLVRRAGAPEWNEVPITHSDTVGRGIGVADMAYALESGRPVRPSGQLAYHVLDLMVSFHDASEAGKHIDVASSVERPAPLPTGLLPGRLDS